MKVPAGTRSSCPKIQTHSCTYRRQKRAQLDLRKHTGEDGPQLHEIAHSKQSPLLWHRSWKLFYTDWPGHPSSHIWYRTKLPDGVHQVRSSRLRIFLPFHSRKTCARQVHGSTILCIPTPQDAGQYMSTFPPWRPQVLRVRQGSDRSWCHNSST